MPTHTTRRPLQGFTLVELVIVIFIIAVVTAIAMPRFAQATDRQQLEAAANRLATDLEKARHHARASSNWVKVAFTKSQEGYNVLTAEGVQTRIRFGQSPYFVEVANAKFGDTTTVFFNGYGLPDNSGYIVLKSSAGTAWVFVDEQGEVSR